MNRIDVVDEYGNKTESIEDFIHRQSFEHNRTITNNTREKKIDTAVGSDTSGSSVGCNGAIDVNHNRTTCCICKSVDGLKIRCAVVGCDEYFHASCLKPHNSLSFTLIKSGRVVMNTLCPFHFEIAVAL